MGTKHSGPTLATPVQLVASRRLGLDGMRVAYTISNELFHQLLASLKWSTHKPATTWKNGHPAAGKRLRKEKAQQMRRTPIALVPRMACGHCASHGQARSAHLSHNPMVLTSAAAHRRSLKCLFARRPGRKVLTRSAGQTLHWAAAQSTRLSACGGRDARVSVCALVILTYRATADTKT